MNTLLIQGLPAIAKACNRRTPETIKRWITRDGFPAAKLPNGQWATTESLINQWLLARRPGSIGANIKPPETELPIGYTPEHNPL